MLKRIAILLVVMIVMVSFLCVAYAQMPQKGSKNTITLPNGDVVWDLNGEWDIFSENYGPWSQFGSARNAAKITQTGSSFVGIRMYDSVWGQPAGTWAIRGELDKNGFKNVQMGSGAGPLDAKGKINEDGNKIVFDDGEKARATFTRK